MTSPPRTCVIAVDQSSESEVALQWYVDNIFRPADCTVLVYVQEQHGIFPPPTSASQSDWADIQARIRNDVEQSKQFVEKCASNLRKQKIPGPIKTVLESGKPGEAIVSAAEKEQADVIIIGSRGQNQLRRTLLGSVSDYVVHHSDVPVLVCKHKKSH